MSLVQILSIVGIVFGLSATAGSTIFIIKGQINKDLIIAQERRITSLKGEMDENNHRCSQEVAELRGQVNTLSSDFSDVLVTKIMTELDSRLFGRRSILTKHLLLEDEDEK